MGQKYQQKKRKKTNKKIKEREEETNGHCEPEKYNQSETRNK